MLLARLSRIYLPAFGALLLFFAISQAFHHPFDSRLIFGGVFGLIFVSLPVMNRRAWRALYRKTPSLQEQTSLEADDMHLALRGQSFTHDSGWENYLRFSESSRVFLIWMKNNRTAHIIPKNQLSVADAEAFRSLLSKKLAVAK